MKESLFSSRNNEHDSWAAVEQFSCSVTGYDSRLLKDQSPEREKNEKQKSYKTINRGKMCSQNTVVVFVDSKWDGSNYALQCNSFTNTPHLAVGNFSRHFCFLFPGDVPYGSNNGRFFIDTSILGLGRRPCVCLHFMDRHIKNVFFGRNRKSRMNDILQLQSPCHEYYFKGYYHHFHKHQVTKFFLSKDQQRFFQSLIMMAIFIENSQADESDESRNVNVEEENVCPSSSSSSSSLSSSSPSSSSSSSSQYKNAFNMAPDADKFYASTATKGSSALSSLPDSAFYGEDHDLGLHASDFYTNNCRNSSAVLEPFQAQVLYKQKQLAKKIKALGLKGCWMQALAIFLCFPHKNAILYNTAITACAHSKRWEEALFLLSRMAVRSQMHVLIEPNPPVSIVRLLRRLIDRKMINISNVPETTKQAVIKPDVFSYTACIMACVKGGNLDIAFKLFEEMKVGDPTNLLQTKSTDSKYSKDQKDSSCKYKFYGSNSMVKVESNGIIDTHSYFRRKFDSKSSLESSRFGETDQELAHVSPNKWTFNILINACAAKQNFQMAYLLLQEMKSRGILPDIVSYNSCINVCCKANQISIAVDLLKEMKHFKIAADRFSYSPCIAYLAAKGDSNGSLQLLRRMLQEGVNPGPFCFSSCILALGNTGHWRNALKLYRSMENYNVSPNLIVCNSVLNALEKGKQPARAKIFIFREMKRKNIPPNNRSFVSVIKAAANMGDWKRALQIMRSMNSSRFALNPCTYCYTACIKACSRGSNWEMALKLLFEMDSKGIRINIITYNTCMDACAKWGKAEYATKILQMMTNRGISPDIVSYNTCMLAYEKSGKYEDALKLLYRIKKSSTCKPDLVTYNTCISANKNAGKWQTALFLLQDMFLAGLKPDVITFNSCISTCERHQQWKLSLKLLSGMPSYGVTPDIISYSACMYICSQANRWKAVHNLFHEMRTQGIQPDLACYHMCFKQLSRRKAVTKFTEVLDIMLQDDLVTPNIATVKIWITACRRAKVVSMWRKVLDIVLKHRISHIDESQLAKNFPLQSNELTKIVIMEGVEFVLVY